MQRKQSFLLKKDKIRKKNVKKKIKIRYNNEKIRTMHCLK